MTRASVNINVQDNGLGQQNPGNGNTLVVIGVGSGGSVPVNTPVTSQTAGAFIAAGGYGPGPQLAELILDESGNEVVFVQATATTPGTNTSVLTALANSGLSTSAVTLSGMPVDTYYGLVTVLTTGTIGSSPGPTVGVSLDAGRGTFLTASLGVGNTLVIPNTGLTLNFGAGLLKQGDQFYWLSTEPSASDASISSAVQSLYSLPFGETPKDIYDAGCTATGGDVTSFDTSMTALFNKRRYMRRYCSARDALWGGTSTESENAWIASIEASHVNDSSLRVGVGAGHYNVTSPVDQVQYRRPAAWVAAVRDASDPIQVDLGRVNDGALAPIVVPSQPTWPPAIQDPVPGSPDGFLYHDENASPSLDAARFMTLCTYVGFPGFYVTSPNLMAPPGSDFNLLEHGAVIDAACLLWYLFATLRLRSGVRVGSNGFILPKDQQSLQLQGTQALRNVLTPGNVVSDVYVTVKSNDNILSTNTLTTQVNVIPLGLLVVISTTITFNNPALAPQGG
jgi:hypothetical protein